MFFSIPDAKSFLMVPGSASSGFVAPMVALAPEIAPSPSRTITTHGPEDMKSVRLPKKGLSLCTW